MVRSSVLSVLLLAMNSMAFIKNFRHSSRIRRESFTTIIQATINTQSSSTSNDESKPTIWVAGEVLIDLIPRAPGKNDDRQAIVGGSGANVAKAAAKLGLNSVFLASLSTDTYGETATAHLLENNVNLKNANTCDKSTCLAIVSLSESGSASYEFKIDGTATFDFSSSWLPSPTRKRDVPSSSSPRIDLSSGSPSLLLVGSLVTVIEPAASELYKWVTELPSHLPIIFDPNIRPAVITDKEFYRAAVEKWVGVSSVVKASDEDINTIYPQKDEKAIVDTWFRLSPRLESVVLTRGAEGIAAYTRSGMQCVVPAVSVDVVDTIGAGDTVSAVLCEALARFGLSSICSGVSANIDGKNKDERSLLERVLRRAARAASVCCSRAGALPPAAAELVDYPF